MYKKTPNPTVVKRCKAWIQDSVQPDVCDKIDWDSEIDPTLSRNENINLLLEKFPEAFESAAIDSYYNRVKQIVFIPLLVEKILADKVHCTYRTTPKHGFYYVMHSRFIKAHLKTPRCVIEVEKTEQVNPYDLTEQDAAYAGLTLKEILDWFRKWYGEPLPLMWRNWFKVKETMPS